MFEVPRLVITRQRRVAQALQDLAGDAKAMKALHADLRAAVQAAAEAGARLETGREFAPLVLDNTTDAVFSALDTLLGAVEQGLNDRVVKPLTEAQSHKRVAATTLRQKVFPTGADFLSLSMPLQYKAMRAAVDALTRDKECAEAVRELGIGWLVEHAAAHLAPYGRAVKAADGRDLDAESDAFHEAFARVVVMVEAHHAKDADARRAVLGAYDTELTAQRADERDARKRAREKKNASKPDA